jgi:hypothetical protein
VLALGYCTILTHPIEIKYMEVTNNNTVLAYLLALRDFSDSLSDKEKESLKTVARDLKIQEKAWKSHIEPTLIQTIAGNPQLHQSYQYYKEQLDQLGAIPTDLLPEVAELDRLKTNEPSLVSRGFIPPTPALRYEQQLNNVVIVVNQTAKPEETVKQLVFLDRVKQFLSQNSP